MNPPRRPTPPRNAGDVRPGAPRPTSDAAVLLEAAPADALAAALANLERGHPDTRDAKTRSRVGLGLPLDTPFRIHERPLGRARLLKLHRPPFGHAWVPPSLASRLPRELPQFTLWLGATVDGDAFVHAVEVDGFRSEVAKAEIVAVAQAVDAWTVVSSLQRGEREVIACADFGEPKFPELPLAELLDKAFAGRKATSLDDPLLDAPMRRFGPRR